MERVIVFLGGICVGSFLNVLIYRIPRSLGFVKGRSFCPKCKKRIRWFDNVPLISFVILEGRCRFCHSPISRRYPAVEMLTGVLFVLTVSQIGLIDPISLIRLICSLILVSGLIVIFFIDLERQIIPDEIVISLSILFFVYFLITNPQLLITNYLITGIVSFLFLYSIYLLTKGKGMGFGDVKFAFLMGLVLGWPKILVAFYLAFLTGALAGFILILARKAKLSQKIAFGPFLAGATLIAYLWGENLISFFQKFLF